ncbi:MAG: hypothetical protein HY761_08420 [Candidatus Omnitrophica bacterium]|nr:hypothetical protein [Candidatus Omnitrophota bacterium]
MLFNDYKKSFIVAHLCFLLSLCAVYFIPTIASLIGDSVLPPMNKHLRFYIIFIFSLVFIFYLLDLYYCNKIRLFESGKSILSGYFWVSTVSVMVFLCSSYALLSSDLFEYSLRARMLSLYNLNPYLSVPVKIKHDFFYPMLFWKNTPECYGPLWVNIGQLHSIFFKNNMFLTSFMHKSILLIFLGLSSFSFYKLASQLRIKNCILLTVAFFMNPLVIIATIIDGHNEIAMTFFILLASLALLRSRYVLALFLLTLAIQVKFVYVLIVPLFILYIFRDTSKKMLLRFLDIITGAVFSLIVVVLLWLPFGKQSLLAIIEYYKNLSLNFWFDSIPFAVYFLLDKMGVVIDKYNIATLFSIVFVLIYVYLLANFVRRIKQDQKIFFTTVSLILLALFITNSTPFQAWYLLWVIPFILLSGTKTRFLLVFLLSYFFILTFWKRMSVLFLPMVISYILVQIYSTKFVKIKGFLYSLEE